MAEEKLRILIIEDEKEVAQTIKAAIQEKVASDCVIESDFEKALQIVGSGFDVVVLDQLKGPQAQGNMAGRPVWKHIYEDAFVPVVVYSAIEVALDENFPTNNPVLIHIAKQRGSDETLAQHLSSRKFVYFGLKHLKAELSQVIRDVFVKVAPVLVSGSADAMQTEATHLARAARRRIAAMMDLKTQLTGENLLAWEQYVYPPLSDQWLTGDVLHKNGSADNDPTTYRIMLTPSCDLPRAPAGKAKVDEALVCRCISFVEFIQAAKASQKNQSEFDDTMKTMLTRAHVNGLIPLPSYHNRIPSMAAKLKSLELIPLSDIGQRGKFTVVASIDSPFREQISWAFIDIHGRPGVPDRDLAEWIKELWQEVQREKKRDGEKAEPKSN